MTRHIVGTVLAVLLTAAAFYTSAYWVFRLWARPGLFDLAFLRPQGDLVAQWLRGTPFQVYDIPLWGIGVFLALTLMQWIWSKLFRD